MRPDRETVERRLREFVDTCRGLRIKATHQRMEIYRELVRTEEHPDAETIYRRVRRRIPAVSLDTVYRNLRLLEEKGLVARVESPGERTRFDARREAHHHFICSRCGSIIDFTSETLDHLPIPSSVRDLGTVQSAQVYVRGVCAECARKAGNRH